MVCVKRCIEILGLCVLIAACSAVQTIAESNGARDAIQIATLFAIEQSSDRKAAAREIISEAENAKSAVELFGAPVDELIDRARSRIAASSAELSTKAALHLLLNRAESELRKRIDEGDISINERVRINRVLDWIIEAASAYAG
jgi:hypothetical protein